jgi:16S rRNA (adenine1518-N6/adenine1519-N6)-dimethyltransferase
MARQRLGQHFLANAIWRERIAQAAFARPSSHTTGTWIEIGAGRGEMTPLLAKHAERVVAIEIDDALIPTLRENIASLANVTVVEGDVLAVDLAELAGGHTFSVYGSLPYYITSPIVHRLFAHAEKLAAAFIVVQLEVAERLTAAPGSRDFGYFSAAAQFYFRPEMMMRIPSGAFSPPPEVASALVALRTPGQRATLGIHDEAAFIHFLKACFARKRKTLYNNLRLLWNTEHAAQALRRAGIDSKARAEELSLTELGRVFIELSALQQGV